MQSILHSKTILAQTLDGRLVEVAPWSNSCSCRAAECSHLEIAKDIYLCGGRKSFWLVLSAMHKEVRRGDLERCLNWGKIYCQISSPNHLLRYVEKILLEETRDIPLLLEIKSGRLSPLQALGMLCQSPKKWTLDYLHRAKHFEQWLESYKIYSREMHLWDAKKLEKTLLTFTSLSEGYQTLFFTSKNSAMKKLFWKAVRVRLLNNQNETVEAFLKSTSSGYYPRQVALEIILNLLPMPGAYRKEIQEPQFYIPCDQPYYSDIHISKGKSLFKRLLPKIMAGEDVSEYGCDLRWSGNIWGCAFRFSAFQQFGNRMNKSTWKDGNILYGRQDIIALDYFFYGDKIYPSHLLTIGSSPSKNLTTS